MKFTYGMLITPDIDIVTETFELLGWAPIFTLPHHIYPDLVQEFYTNIDNQKGHSGVKINSFVRGRRLTITRVTIDPILEYNNQGPVIDLKNGFTSPNKH